MTLALNILRCKQFIVEAHKKKLHSTLFDTLCSLISVFQLFNPLLFPLFLCKVWMTAPQCEDLCFHTWHQIHPSHSVLFKESFQDISEWTFASLDCTFSWVSDIRSLKTRGVYPDDIRLKERAALWQNVQMLQSISINTYYTQLHRLFQQLLLKHEPLKHTF